MCTMCKPVEALDGCELWCWYRELNLGLCKSNSALNCWGVSPAQELFMENYYSRAQCDIFCDRIFECFHKTLLFLLVVSH